MSDVKKKGLDLHWQILIAMVAGIAVALLTKATYDWHSTTDFAHYLFTFCDIVGGLFMKLLKMIIMPLIFASVVSSITSMPDSTALRSVGGKALLFYATTTALAVVTGILVVNLINPGEGLGLEAQAAPDKEPGSIADLILAMVPDNIFGALASNSSILSVIVFGLLFALGILAVGKRAAPLARGVDALGEVMMKLTVWIIQLTPYGVFALIVTTLLKTGNDLSTDADLFLKLGAYMLTVIGALLIHATIVLPLLYSVLTKRSPLNFARAMKVPLLTAFGTASSSATLPLTMQAAELRGGVSPRISGFVLPLGATVNMDGTALYESVAAIFIAQAFGIDLSLGDQVIIFLTATLAAIGAAGIPSAGLVTMLIVLESVGLPKEGYGLIVAVDRLLDMCRTTVNVWGDSIGSAVVAAQEDELGPENIDGPVDSEAWAAKRSETARRQDEGEAA